MRNAATDDEFLEDADVSGVGLDVLAVEPIAPDDPVRAVLDHPGVIVTPHVAWAGRAAQQRVADVLSEHMDRLGAA